MGRTTLLLGRYLGNLFVVLLNHIYLIGSIWLIIGIKTAIWDVHFLLAIPITVFTFAVLLCVVVLIGVVSESAALSTMVAVALMLISTILAQRKFVVRLLDSEWSRQLWLTFYWIIPKVFDLGNGLRQIILPEHDADLLVPILTSAAFGLGVMMMAILLIPEKRLLVRFIPLALSACVLLGSCHKSNVAGVEIDSRLTGYILPRLQSSGRHQPRQNQAE